MNTVAYDMDLNVLEHYNIKRRFLCGTLFWQGGQEWLHIRRCCWIVKVAEKSKQIAGESDRKIKVKRREELSVMYNGKKRYESLKRKMIRGDDGIQDSSA